MEPYEGQNGDIVVCGVAEDKHIEDINVFVPKGVAVAIPGLLACKSRELWVFVSQGILFKLDVSNVLRIPTMRKNINESTQRELARLQEENDAFKRENASLKQRLEEESSRANGLNGELLSYRGELQKLRDSLLSQQGSDSKLDLVLQLLKDRPQVQQVMVSAGGSFNGFSPTAKDDDAPMFIPTNFESESGAGGRIDVKEESSDGSSLSDASKALRALKRKTQ
jgi:hypothetical protein